MVCVDTNHGGEISPTGRNDSGTVPSLIAESTPLLGGVRGGFALRAAVKRFLLPLEMTQSPYFVLRISYFSTSHLPTFQLSSLPALEMTPRPYFVFRISYFHFPLPNWVRVLPIRLGGLQTPKLPYQTLKGEYKTWKLPYQTLKREYKTCKLPYQTLKLEYITCKLTYQTLKGEYKTCKLPSFRCIYSSLRQGSQKKEPEYTFRLKGC